MPPWRAGGRPAATGPLSIAEVKGPGAAPPAAAAPRPAPQGPAALRPEPAAEESEESAGDQGHGPGQDPAEHPLVKQAIELFNARIVDVQPKRD